MANVTYSCIFSEPLRFDGTPPTGPNKYNEQWQFHKENCTYSTAMYAPTTTIASSTDIQIYGSFTAGELVMSFLMLILIVVELGKIIAHGLDKVNLRRFFIRFNDKDTEITNDII